MEEEEQTNSLGKNPPLNKMGHHSTAITMENNTSVKETRTEVIVTKTAITITWLPD